MKTSQAGIFSLGGTLHVYLEWDALDEAKLPTLVTTLASLRGPRLTVGGVNMVCGFRPRVWHAVAPDDAPDGLHGFSQPLIGPDGFAMPATQHDAFIWLSGNGYDVLFDATREITAALDGLATLADETTSWPYHRNRDLTGFEDGTENPALPEAHEVACIADGNPGAGGSVLLVQKWIHDAASWESLAVSEQERVMGRTKSDSIELDDKPASSHVARTDQETFGHIFRRNMPFGTTAQHGTMFIGFCAEQRPLEAMLESMAGVTDQVRDALTHYTHPISGAYYFVPAMERLRELAAASEG